MKQDLRGLGFSCALFGSISIVCCGGEPKDASVVSDQSSQLEMGSSSKGRPPRVPNDSAVYAIAHMAYHVTDLAQARHFWEDYLGLGEPFAVSSKAAIIKVNEEQYVEL